MLRLRGNALGFAMIVASALVAGVGGLILKLSDPLVMIGVGVALILMDVLIRWRSWPTAGWLTHKECGGYLYFVPIWGLGIFVIGVNVVNILVNLSG